MNEFAPINIQSGISKQDVNLSYPDDIKAKIVHLLEVYPIISPSMMQIGIGSSLPSKMWKPILRQLIADDIVKEQVIAHLGSTGRHQSYTLLSLKATPTNLPK